MGKRVMLFLIIILCTLQNYAQIKTTDEPLKWDLSFAVGQSFMGPSEKDFIQENPPTPCLPSSAITSFHNHIPWNLEFRRSLTKNITAGICVTKRGFEGSFFTIKHKFKSVGISPILLFNFKNIFLIGGGPLIFSIRQLDCHNPDWPTVYKNHDLGGNFLGYEIKSSFRFPWKNRFYATIDANYCHTGKINQCEFTNVLAGPNEEPLMYYVYDLDMNYIFTGIGIGFRF